MARLTITLSDERQRALRESAASCGKTIGQLIDDSLEAYGIKTRQRATELVAAARQRAAMDESRAMTAALEETERQRHHS